MRLPRALEALIAELQKLPTIGGRSAQRLAIHLLQKRDTDARLLAEAIQRMAEEITLCARCGNIADAEICLVCQEVDRGRRTPEVLCVVEQPGDIIALEKTSEYKGAYHVLHGALSPLKGVNPEDLNLDSLMARLNEVREIIIATNPNTEGEATAMYLSKVLAGRVKVSRLAFGLPMGTQLEYTDSVTLAKALSGRLSFSHQRPDEPSEDEPF